jgi:hypothetical protein
MTVQLSDFEDCSLKNLYESLLHAATTMNSCLDIMLTHNYTSGTYIDAKVSLSEWERAYDTVRIVLSNKFGDVMANNIEQMVNTEIQLINQRRKIFG